MKGAGERGHLSIRRIFEVDGKYKDHYRVYCSCQESQECKALYSNLASNTTKCRANQEKKHFQDPCQILEFTGPFCRQFKSFLLRSKPLSFVVATISTSANHTSAERAMAGSSI